MLSGPMAPMGLFLPLTHNTSLAGTVGLRFPASNLTELLPPRTLLLC